MVHLIIFLPLLGFLYCAFIGKKFYYRYSQLITSSFLFISSILSWILFIKYFGSEKNKTIFLFNWISSGNFTADWSFKLDTLTIVMFLVVTTVSTLVHIYSIGYMAHDNSKNRFMGFLSLFTFFMLVLVSSDNLLQMFFGWEGVGLSSYLLIGFWHHKEKANLAAIKAFILNRIGDFSFLLGIVVIFFVFETINFDLIFNRAIYFSNHEIIFLGLNFSTINIICFLLFIGAMGKSAQLGLHTWLPDAMEGPTPVSALIHAATMVTAGVFMIARMSPLFEYAHYTNLFIIFIGATTAIFAATIAMTQNDIKKVIAYSTCSQLGYMFFAAGLGAYNSAIFHLSTHAFFKALLFLSAGSVIHMLHHEQDMRKMGGIFKKMPLTGSMMWIGSLAIIGFPFFSGYYSKESILENAYFANSHMGYYAYIIGILTALLTAFYSWRLLFLTFHGNTSVNNKKFNDLKDSPKVMTIPLFCLGFGSIFFGMFFYKYFIGDEQIKFWNDSIVLLNEKKHAMPFIQILIIKLSVAFGILIATFIYFYKKNIPALISKNFRALYSLFLNKWYFDEIYNFIFVKPFFYISTFFWKQGDQNFIDAYGPNGISKLTKFLSREYSKFHSGYLYQYAFIMICGLVIFLTFVSFF